VRQAQDRRNAGTRRVRRASVVVATLALSASGLLAMAAAASTHSKRVIVRAVAVKRRAPHVTAPAPPLVAVAGARAGSAPAQKPAPAPPPAPVPAPVTPVVVSGGS
jgi:hypothetical protein